MIDDIIIEEATELTVDDYSQLQLRLRSNKPNNQVILMYNPVSKANWVYKMFHENGCPDNCKVIHTTWNCCIKSIPLRIESLPFLAALTLYNPNFLRWSIDLGSAESNVIISFA